MSKKDIYKILSLYMSLNNDYNIFSEIIFDEKVNDCLIKLYFSIMCDEKEQSDKYYEEFEKMYKELSDEQQEIAKVEIAKILKIEYKPKTKKKER